MRVFVLVLFVVVKFGNAQGDAQGDVLDDAYLFTYDRGFDDDYYHCTETSLRVRSVYQRRFMWWQYDACRSGRTYVTCSGDLKCGNVRERCGGRCTLWTNTRGTSSVSQANDFVDTLLLQKMPALIRESSGYFSLPSYYFRVHSTSWRDNDLEVDVISGRFRNFKSAVRRRGNCVHSMVAGNVTITCGLSIDGVVAELMTETECGCWYDSKNYIHVDGRMCGTTGRLEVTSARNEPAFLRTFIVDNSCFEVTLGDNLYLSSTRRNNFESHIRRYLVLQLQQKFRSYYETTLEHAFSSMSFSLF